MLLGKYYNTRTIEKFEDKKSNIVKLKTIEMLENQVLSGGFINKNLENKVIFKIGEIGLEYNYKDVNKGLTVIIDKKSSYAPLVLQKDIEYNYKLLIFPLDSLMFILIKSSKEKEYRLVYTIHNQKISNKSSIDLTGEVNDVVKYLPIKIEKNTYSIYSGENELFRLMDVNKKVYLNTNGNKLELLNKNDVEDKKSVIWNLEKRDGYFTIKNIVNNLYLSVKGNSLVLDNKKDNSIKYYILSDKKGNTIISLLGKVLRIEKLEQGNLIGEIIMEKVDNIGQWLTYGSAINIINNTNQYMSGNLNMKYPSTGLFSVYCDNIGQKDLILWLIEDYLGKKNGYYVKEGDEVYLKNNNMYLQIIKGNNSPSNLGLEISLGSQKNDNSKWIITRKEGKDRLFRKGLEVYLYHPKMDVYLYNSNKTFMLLNNEKTEIIGNNRKDGKSLWKIDTISIDYNKATDIGKVDFYKYTDNNKYYKQKEEEWKKALVKENELVKSQLTKFNELKNREKTVLESINKTNDDIRKILGEKCPPTKVCVNPIDLSCLPQKKDKNQQKKEKEELYSIVYLKDSNVKSNPYYVNSNIVKKCKTLKDYDINESPLIKNKKYVAREGAKLKITDFKLTDFPEAADLVSIETIPDDKKITDFRIEELPGFENLELKK